MIYKRSRFPFRFFFRVLPFPHSSSSSLIHNFLTSVISKSLNVDGRCRTIEQTNQYVDVVRLLYVNSSPSVRTGPFALKLRVTASQFAICMSCVVCLPFLFCVSLVLLIFFVFSLLYNIYIYFLFFFNFYFLINSL